MNNWIMHIDDIRKSRRTIKLLTWAQQNHHLVRELGFIFFTLALLMGVVWISGRDVEPIVYVLGSISTLLFASPALARYALPRQKPVRDMRYEEILDFVISSNSQYDWRLLQTRQAEEAFLRDDPRLRLKIRYDKDGLHEEDIKEPWVSKVSTQPANSYWCELSYDCALLERCALVSIDNGRAILPLPVSGTGEVDPLSYKVAQIFDQSGNLEINLNKAGFTIK